AARDRTRRGSPTGLDPDRPDLRLRLLRSLLRPPSRRYRGTVRRGEPGFGVRARGPAARFVRAPVCRRTPARAADPPALRDQSARQRPFTRAGSRIALLRAAVSRARRPARFGARLGLRPNLRFA